MERPSLPPTSTLLAIDPGTYRTGLALFTGQKLDTCMVLEADSSAPVEERIAWLVAKVESIHKSHPALRMFACEFSSGLGQYRPAPELEVLVRRMRQYVRKHHGLWFQYHPSTVAASVRIRGLGKVMTPKERIAFGVQALYGMDYPLDGVEQDALDAVAVGHCHWTRPETAK